MLIRGCFIFICPPQVSDGTELSYKTEVTHVKKNQAAPKKESGENPEFTKIANRVSLVTIAANAALSLFKLLAGVLAHSGAMISDAVHSASDVFRRIL